MDHVVVTDFYNSSLAQESLCGDITKFSLHYTALEEIKVEHMQA
jgi:hypothetical protein